MGLVAFVFRGDCLIPPKFRIFECKPQVMKMLLILLLCLPLAVCAGVSVHPPQSGDHSSRVIASLTPLKPFIALVPTDTLPYTIQEVRRNTKTGQVLLTTGLVSVFSPVLYLAALVGAPVLPQLFFILGTLSFVWGAIKFIQSRIRLRRFRAYQQKNSGG